MAVTSFGEKDRAAITITNQGGWGYCLFLFGGGEGSLRDVMCVEFVPTASVIIPLKVQLWTNPI